MSSAPLPPDWRGAGRVLLHSGSVYSPADPFATAMLVAGPEIAWIGSEGAALAMSDGVDEVIDLAGALVTAASADANANPGGSIADWRMAAARHGVGLGHVFTDETGGCDGPGPILVAGGAVCVVHEGMPAARIGEHVAQAIGAGQPPVIMVAAHELMPVALEGLDSSVRELGRGAVAAAGTRVDVAAASPADAVALAAVGASVCALLSPENGFAPIALAALAAEGVPLAFGSHGPDPLNVWEALAAAVHHPDASQRISARAAFAACTRGGWRAAGMPEAGALIPGAPAHFTVWATGDLVVQAPDERISAWSTDPRSGTPGLPDVSSGAAPPRCLRTVVWGAPVFAC